MKKNNYHSLVISLLIFLLVRSVSAQNPGDLDPTFGNNSGLFINVIAGGLGQFYTANSILRSDGKIVVGSTYAFNLATVRLNSDGSLDNSFGTNGLAWSSFPSLINGATSKIAVDSAGNTLIIGYAQNDTSGIYQTVVARFDSSGHLDPTFGNQGYITFAGLDSTVGESIGTTIACEPNGKILLAGCTFNSVASYAFVMRLNYDGSIDSTTFDYANNHLIRSIGFISDLSVLNNGEILYTSGNLYISVASGRLLPNGDIDSSFGVSGFYTFPFNQVPEFSLSQLLVSSNGKFYAYGNAGAVGGPYNSFAIACFNANGEPDSTFGTNGFTYTTMPLECSMGNLLMQSDGKLIGMGTLNHGNFSNSPHDFLSARYNTDGTLDPSYGNLGIVITQFPSTNAFASTGIIQSDGKLVLIGNQMFNSIASARYYLDAPSSLYYSQSKGISFDAYPNPAKSSFTITSCSMGNAILQVFDPLGKQVLQRTIDEKTTIDCSMWNAGVYHLQLRSGSTLISRKLVIE